MNDEFDDDDEDIEAVECECESCGAEFIIEPVNTTEEVQFCPFCGSEIEDIDEDGLEEDYFDT
jgi:Zn finger protein HypA/HybF involved in hydrogenase expression